VCIRVGKFGLEWGEKYRSQIFFWAFWVSFISWIFLAAALACISWHDSTVRNVSFFEGTVTYTSPQTGKKFDMDFFAGLNIIVVDACNEPECPPDTSFSWSDISCEASFSHCNSCRDASLGSISMVIMSFVTQFPQITSDVGRSMGKNVKTFKFLLFSLSGLYSLAVYLMPYENNLFIFGIETGCIRRCNTW
jgi:hypothetical protein